MCLIAVAKNKTMIPLGNLENAQKRNPDGFGIMFPQDGRVVTMRSIMGGKDAWKMFLDLWGQVPADVSVGVHFRFATKGAINESNCHPYKVTDRDSHGQDIFLMHNGTLHDFPGSKERSDTREMAEDILRPMLARGPRYIRTKNFRDVCALLIGKNSKFVFLEGCVNWHWVNYAAGEVIDSVWYSNRYSIEATRTSWDDDDSWAGYFAKDKSRRQWNPEAAGFKFDASRKTWYKESWGERDAKTGRYRRKTPLATIPPDPVSPLCDVPSFDGFQFQQENLRVLNLAELYNLTVLHPAQMAKAYCDVFPGQSLPAIESLATQNPDALSDDLFEGLGGTRPSWSY